VRRGGGRAAGCLAAVVRKKRRSFQQFSGAGSSPSPHRLLLSVLLPYRSSVRPAGEPLPAQHVAVGLSPTAPAGPSCAPRRTPTPPSSPEQPRAALSSAPPHVGSGRPQPPLAWPSVGQHRTAAAPRFSGGAGRGIAGIPVTSVLFFSFFFLFFFSFPKSAIWGHWCTQDGRPVLLGAAQGRDGRTGRASLPLTRAVPGRSAVRRGASPRREELLCSPTVRAAEPGRSAARPEPKRAGESLRAARFRAQPAPLPSAARWGGGAAAVGARPSERRCFRSTPSRAFCAAPRGKMKRGSSVPTPRGAPLPYGAAERAARGVGGSVRGIVRTRLYNVL